MRAFFLGLLLFLAFKPSLQQEEVGELGQAQFLAQDTECSASKPCELGCCSSAGHCGYGPDFCGDGCQSNCERKAECNPGWEGDQWSERDECPLKVCCSEYGFCGTTDQFCGDEEVDRPSCSSSTPVKRVIGYYEAWSKTERSCYGMLPEEIPFGYYTHINFAFATIDPQTFELIPGNDRTDDYMHRIQSLKFIQPDLQVWIAVGGWTFNDPGPTATTFSDIAASTSAQDAFINSLIKIMNTYGFDGLDLDWEYPVAEDRSGRDEDFKNFVTFMERLRKKLNDKGMSKKGISLTLPSSYWYMQHFDIVNLEKTVDWFNIMSYDVHGSWDIDNDHTGPWVNSHTNMTEIQDALDLLWRNKIDPDKVVMGHAFYSRSFALADPNCSEPGCRVVSGGNAGKCSGTTGVLLHAEIQDIIRERGLTPKLYRDATYKAVHWGDQWVSFDDLATWRLKNNIFRSQCISGIMVWAASQDDKQSTNLKALVSSVGRTIMDAPDFSERPVEQPQPVVQEPPKSCTWTGCGQECPSGFKLIWRKSKPKEIFGDGCTVGGMSKWCCPANQDLPVCEWRGHRNTGRCKPGCNSDEVEVGGIRVGCSSGYQSACCTVTDSTKAFGSCAWTTGSCDLGEKQSCPAGRPKRVEGAAWAWGGVPPCGWGPTERTYCCPEEMPEEFKKCRWITDVEDRTGKYCDACRDDQIKIADRSNSDCLTPYEALCCDRPKLEKRDEFDEPAYDPFGDSQARQLRALIEAYVEDPTCPALELEPPIPDVFQKRSAVGEAQENGLSKRADDCSLSNFNMLRTHGTNLIVMRSEYMNELEDIWDDELAGPLDEQYEIRNLRNYSDMFPTNDPANTVVNILYNPTEAGTHIRRAREFPSVLCGLDYSESGSRSEKRDILSYAEIDSRSHHPVKTGEEDADELDSRSIWVYGGRNAGFSRNDVPNLTDILRAIMEGGLSLHYARWQWYTGATGAHPEGPMLELAYWIGPEPGVAPSQPSLYDQFRDTRSGRTGDRWVVFHLHFDPNQSWLHRHDGTIYMGANSVTVFHGHASDTYNDGGRTDWRVRNDATDSSGDNQNARNIINCGRFSPNRLWYVGYQVTIPDRITGDDRLWMQLMQDWGRMLFNDGYTGRRAYQLIYPRTRVIPGSDRVDAGEGRDGWAQSGSLTDENGNDGYVWHSNWYINEEGLLRRNPRGPPSNS